MKWNILLLKIGIAIVMVVVIALVRVLVRAISERSRSKHYSAPLPPPPPLKPAGPPPAAKTPPAPVPAAKPAPPAVKKPVLVGVAGVYQGAVVPFDNATIIIGRDPAASNLVFPDEQRTISARHCTVKAANGRFYVEDCFSTNGTYLGNGKSVTPGQSVELKTGDRFSIGDRKNVFEVAFR